MNGFFISELINFLSVNKPRGMWFMMGDPAHMRMALDQLDRSGWALLIILTLWSMAHKFNIFILKEFGPSSPFNWCKTHDPVTIRRDPGFPNPLDWSTVGPQDQAISMDKMCTRSLVCDSILFFLLILGDWREFELMILGSQLVMVVWSHLLSSLNLIVDDGWINVKMGRVPFARVDVCGRV